MSVKSELLDRALEAKIIEGRELRARYGAVAERLAIDSGNPEALRAVIELESALARNAQGESLLTEARDNAISQERAERFAEAAKALQGQTASAINASEERLKLAASIQSTSDKLAAQVAEFHSLGEPLRNDIGRILSQLHAGDPARFQHYASFTLPAASGTSRRMAEAVAAVCLQVTRALGSSHSNEYGLVDSFTTPRVRFIDAAKADHEALRLRMSDAAQVRAVVQSPDDDQAPRTLSAAQESRAFGH